MINHNKFLPSLELMANLESKDEVHNHHGLYLWKKEKFPDQLRSARAELDLSRSRFSSLTGIPERTIQYYEQGAYFPSKKSMLKLLKFLRNKNEQDDRKRSI